MTARPVAAPNTGGAALARPRRPQLVAEKLRPAPIQFLDGDSRPQTPLPERRAAVSRFVTERPPGAPVPCPPSPPAAWPPGAWSLGRRLPSGGGREAAGARGQCWGKAARTETRLPAPSSGGSRGAKAAPPCPQHPRPGHPWDVRRPRADAIPGYVFPRGCSNLYFSSFPAFQLSSAGPPPRGGRQRVPLARGGGRGSLHFVHFVEIAVSAFRRHDNGSPANDSGRHKGRRELPPGPQPFSEGYGVPELPAAGSGPGLGPGCSPQSPAAPRSQRKLRAEMPEGADLRGSGGERAPAHARCPSLRRFRGCLLQRPQNVQIFPQPEQETKEEAAQVSKAWRPRISSREPAAPGPAAASRPQQVGFGTCP